MWPWALGILPPPQPLHAPIQKHKTKQKPLTLIQRPRPSSWRAGPGGAALQPKCQTETAQTEPRGRPGAGSPPAPTSALRRHPPTTRSASSHLLWPKLFSKGQWPESNNVKEVTPWPSTLSTGSRCSRLPASLQHGQTLKGICVSVDVGELPVLCASLQWPLKSSSHWQLWAPIPHPGATVADVPRPQGPRHGPAWLHSGLLNLVGSNYHYSANF